MRIHNAVARSVEIQMKLAANGNLRRSLHKTDGGLDIAAYGSAIQHCTNHRLIRQGKQLHARLFPFSIPPDNFLASKLITFYAKSNLTLQARNVFDAIPHKNTFSWNAMLIAYSSNALFLDALNLFASLLASSVPDNFTITCVLKALASSSSSSPESAKQVHCFVLRRGLDSDVFVLNALVTCYCRCGEIRTARKVFDGMTVRDTVTWNSMIGGYSQCGYYEECKRLYMDMLGVSGVSVSPNAVTIVSVMQACGQSKDLLFGMEVHRLVNERGIEMDVSLCNAVIAMYAKCGSLDYARELFDEMSERDEVSYGSVISGYMVYGFVEKALDVFRGMGNPGLSTWNAVISGMVQNNRFEGVLDLVREMMMGYGLKPNAVTLASILPLFSQFSNLRGGKEVHAYALRTRCDQNVYVATAIVDAYAKLGFIHGAREVFDRSRSRSLIIWTAIISAYAAHGDAGLALGLYAQMLGRGIQPDPVTLTSLLTACAHSGLVDEAWDIFNAMPSKYGIQPLVEHYACMVGVLSRAGKLSEAAKFISEMPIEPSAKVWGALLHGASVYGDVEMGKFVCDHLFEIEPENTGNYVIMANLYSRAGRWEEAGKVRKRMEGIGLQKIRGSSWIETSGRLIGFIAKDVSNEISDEIYTLLEGLLGLMREEGYILQEEFDCEM